MSIQIVERYYDAFNKRDIDAILAICADDVINVPNQGDAQAGKQKLKSFIETAWAHFDEKVFNLELLSSPNSTKVASEYLVKGTYYNTKSGLFPANNQYYEIICSTIFNVKNGEITQLTRYYNTKTWLDIVNPERNN